MSEVAVATMTEQEAQRLTERIRLTAHNYAEARQKLQELVAEAKSGNAHLALGYASWTAYLREVLGEEPMRLASEVRPEMAALLSSEGMPAPVIATVLGVSDKTIRRDLKGGQMSTFEPRVLTRTDGNDYTVNAASEPQQPKRAPLPEQYFNAVYDLGRVIERIQKLTTDDRFNRNKAEISGKHASDLSRHHHTLTTLISELTN